MYVDLTEQPTDRHLAAGLSVGLSISLSVGLSFGLSVGIEVSLPASFLSWSVYLSVGQFVRLFGLNVLTFNHD